jgi:hypothetical protein
MRSIRLLHLLPLIGATALASASCYVRAGAGGYANRPVVFTEPPTLVYTDSNVWVVRDSQQPVYYVDGHYYAYTDDVWYRSDSYEDGWTRVEPGAVPAVIVHRDHRAYVNYRGSPDARVRPAPRGPSMTPASDARPPGQRGAPPGLQREPPGQAGAPPGQRGAPPGLQDTPPGQGGTPPGLEQRDAPPGQRGAPPATRGAPAEPPRAAPPAAPDRGAAPAPKRPPQAEDEDRPDQKKRGDERKNQPERKQKDQREKKNR